MDSDELTNKLLDLLNEIVINKEGRLTVRSTNLSKELLEILKIIENCTNCKDKIRKNYLDEFLESIDTIENLLAELKKEKKEYKLNNKLIRIDNELNKKILCESCKGKKIEKLTDKYGNEEMARLLYECKLNADDDYRYIRWIPFNEFRNIEYLAKGGFGEVHKAIWIDYHNINGYVVLKRIYNSSNKIIDILKEVRKKKV